jgi:drug/metabolite transporter (DMT)-like permease
MDPPARPLLPLAAFSLCTLIWGSTFLFIRIGNDYLPPLWGVTIRLALASVLLSAIVAAARRPWPRGAALQAALLFGVVDFGLSLPLLYWGERDVPSGVAAILYATIPLMTAGFARAAGLERVRPLKLLGALVGLSGVALLVSSELRGHMPPLPLLAVFLGAATAALAGVLLKRSPGGDPLATNAIAHGVGIPFCLVASLLLHERRTLPGSLAAWLPIAYLTIVGSVVAFVTFVWLVQRWSVVRISFIAVIIPVLATSLGALVRHERLGAWVLLGALVVLAGVLIAVASDARERAPAS